MADNRTGLASVEKFKEQHHLTFYKLDKETGAIIEMPRLPADPPFYQRYLSRGYVTDKRLLEDESKVLKAKLGQEEIVNPAEAVDKELISDTPTEVKSLTVEPVSSGWICDDCGFEAKSEFGLKAHMKKHKY